MNHIQALHRCACLSKFQEVVDNVFIAVFPLFLYITHLPPTQPRMPIIKIIHFRKFDFQRPQVLELCQLLENVFYMLRKGEIGDAG